MGTFLLRDDSAGSGFKIHHGELSRTLSFSIPMRVEGQTYLVLSPRRKPESPAPNMPAVFP